MGIGLTPAILAKGVRVVSTIGTFFGKKNKKLDDAQGVVSMTVDTVVGVINTNTSYMISPMISAQIKRVILDDVIAAFAFRSEGSTISESDSVNLITTVFEKLESFKSEKFEIEQPVTCCPGCGMNFNPHEGVIQYGANATIFRSPHENADSLLYIDPKSKYTMTIQALEDLSSIS